MVLDTNHQDKKNESKKHYYNYHPYYNINIPKVNNNTQFFINNKHQFNNVQRKMVQHQVPMSLVQDETGKLYQLVYSMPVDQYNQYMKYLTDINKQRLNTGVHKMTKMEQLELIAKSGKEIDHFVTAKGKNKSQNRSKSDSTSKNNKSKKISRTVSLDSKSSILPDSPTEIKNMLAAIKKENVITRKECTDKLENKNSEIKRALNEINFNLTELDDNSTSNVNDDHMIYSDMIDKELENICSMANENNNLNLGELKISENFDNSNESPLVEDNDSAFEDGGSITTVDNSPSCMSEDFIDDFMTNSPECIDTDILNSTEDEISKNQQNRGNFDLEKVYNNLCLLKEEDIFPGFSGNVDNNLASSSDKIVKPAESSKEFSIINDLKNNETLDFTIFAQNSYVETF